MTCLYLSASAKLAVIWIINLKLVLHSESKIRFDLSYFRFFIVNFVHLELLLSFYIASFKFFLHKND